MAHGPSKDTTHTHTESQIYDLAHDDTNAIHDDESGEISALTEKTGVVGNDLLLMEDSAASFAKKKITIANAGFGSADIVHVESSLGINVATDPETLISASVTAAAGDVYFIRAYGTITNTDSLNARQFTMYHDIGTSTDPGTSTAYDKTANSTASFHYDGWVVVESTSDTYCHGMMYAEEGNQVSGTGYAVSNSLGQLYEIHYNTDKTGSTTINLRCASEVATDFDIDIYACIIRKVAQ